VQPARGRPDATHAAISSAHAPRHSFAKETAWLHAGASVAHITTAAIHPRLVPTPRISASRLPSAFLDRVRPPGQWARAFATINTRREQTSREPPTAARLNFL